MKVRQVEKIVEEGQPRVKWVEERLRRAQGSGVLGIGLGRVDVLAHHVQAGTCATDRHTPIDQFVDGVLDRRPAPESNVLGLVAPGEPERSALRIVWMTKGSDAASRVRTMSVAAESGRRPLAAVIAKMPSL